MLPAALTAWVQSRFVGVLGFGCVLVLFLSAFTLTGSFFGFEFARLRPQNSNPFPPEEDRVYPDEPCVVVPYPEKPTEIYCERPPDSLDLYILPHLPGDLFPPQE